jgi:hypothetical protein
VQDLDPLIFLNLKNGLAEALENSDYPIERSLLFSDKIMAFVTGSHGSGISFGHCLSSLRIKSIEPHYPP